MPGLHFFAILIFVCLPFFSETASFVQYVSKPPFTIFIDAGHGGKDAGASGKNVYEKDIALKIALKLGAYLQQNLTAVRVLYSRTNDIFVPLHKRVELANEQKADVFFSIHCNAMIDNPSPVKGTETYVMGLHNAQENLSVAKRENKVVLMEKDYTNNYQGFDPSSDEGHIVLSMFQNAHLSQSLLLAQQVENQFSTTAKRKSRGVKQAGFVVLRTTTMPSILVETGFLSNLEESKYLNSEKGQVYTASAMYRAIKAYKKTLEAGGLGFKNQFSARGQANNPTTPTPSKERVSTPKLTTVDTVSNKITVSPAIPTETSSPAIEDMYPSSSSKAVSYSVQLASSPTAFDLKKLPWRALKGLRCIQIGTSYKCLYGAYTDFSAAIQQQNRLRKEGFKDAFLVAFQQGKKIPLPPR